MRYSALCVTGAALILMIGCTPNSWRENPVVGPESPPEPEGIDSLCFTCPGDSVSMSRPLRARADSTVDSSGVMTYHAVVVAFVDSVFTSWYNGEPTPGPYITWCVGPSFDPTYGWGDRSLTPRGTELRPHTVRFVIPCPAVLDTITFSLLFTDMTGAVVGWPYTLDSPATTPDRFYRIVCGPGVAQPLP